MNFGEIKTDVLGKLGGRSIPDLLTAIDSGIKNAIRQNICQERNYWFMRKDLTPFVTTAALATYLLPTDFKELQELWWEDLVTEDWGDLPTISENMYTEQYTNVEDSTPERVLLLPTQFKLGPAPDIAYNINGVYWSFMDALSANTDTNYLTESWPNLLIAFGVKAGLEYLEETQLAVVWEAKIYNPINGRPPGMMAQFNRAMTLRELSGDITLAPRSGVKGREDIGRGYQ
jgi:hypothetical protein